MKWLAFILLLLPIQLIAETTEDQQARILYLPTSMICSPLPPEITLERFNEIGFVTGDAQIFMVDGKPLEGELIMYVNPDTRSFTVIFHVEDLYCATMTGIKLEPFFRGESL